jgi:RNA polymerase sigma factor (sigma-70 family)
LPADQLSVEMKKEKRQIVSELYEKFWKELYIVAFRRLGSEEEVEDILHDIFLSLLTEDVLLDNDTSVRAFLHLRLKSRIINHYRKQLVRSSFAKDEQYRMDISTSDNYTLHRELEGIVQEEIAKMPGKMKEIFLLSRNNQLSNEEIATQLNLSNQTVRNQISMAIKRIRLAVQGYHHPAINTIITILMLTQY